MMSQGSCVTIVRKKFVTAITYYHTYVHLSTFILVCSNGDIRLTGGLSDSDGTVEVCYSNIWGLIEVSGWKESDAIVICRQLGFSTSGKYRL